MHFKDIKPSELQFNPFTATAKQWMLITSGDENGYNTMTASWGGFGTMFAKDVVEVVVRPSRHTYGFMEKHKYFTVSFYSEEYRSALKFCGARSGRDVDKAKETGLTPVFLDGTTAFEEASLIFVCKTLYAHDLVPECFRDEETHQFYGSTDYHRAYLAEVVKVYQQS